MQDRFKFRAWDKRHKEYAYDVQNEFQKYGHMICETLDFGQVLNDDELELEQCTGLTDKNNKLIYEGDILKFRDEPNDYEWTGRIEFGNPNYGYTWGFQIVHLSGPKPNIDTLCWFDMEEGRVYSEVIGTVFDEEVVD